MVVSRFRRSWVLLLIVCLANRSAVGQESLEEQFRSPPPTSRPQTWWHWMNGRVTKAGITADLEWMQRVGLGGFQMFHIVDGLEPGPVGYMTNQWREMVLHAAQESDRLGLEMCLHNCAGWSSTGGPWITPELAMQEVVWVEQQVEGGRPLTLRLKRPNTKLYYYRDIGVLAFPTPKWELAGNSPRRISDWKEKAAYRRKNDLRPDTREFTSDQIVPLEKIVNLTDRMDDAGVLHWTPGDGHWTIMRIGHTPTTQTNLPAPPEGEGLECDKLSARAARVHWENAAEPVLEDLGPLVGKSLRYVLIDSYEARHHNWTEGFDRTFRQRAGYDLHRWLVAFTGRVVENVDATERFLWDMRHIIGALTAENYYQVFQELCHERGLALAAEPYGYWGIFNDFDATPYADLPMGEFWMNRPNAWFAPTTKLASSAAHAYGRRIVGAESFTSGTGSAEWLNYPGKLKTLGDHHFCQGLNRIIFHTCVHQPWLRAKPGMTMWKWGMQMNRNNTWAEQARPWLEYMARAQFLLQQGEFVADFCYLATEETPNSFGGRSTLAPAPPLGYDYDVLAASALATMNVEHNRIVLPSGMSYRVLVLPATDRMRPWMLEEALRLARAGVTIVAAKQPSSSPSMENFPECDALVKQLAEELWSLQSFHPLGAEQDFAELIDRLPLTPDFSCKELPVGEDIEYLHRRADDADIYFLSNQRYGRCSISPEFRIAGKIPEIWYPETGRVESCPIWRSLDSGRTEVTLTLEPAESVFVVFRREVRDENPLVEVTKDGRPFAMRNVPGDAVTVERAEYGNLNGTEQLRADVTELIARFAKDGKCSVPVSNYLASDPARNQKKQLRVAYRIDGEQHEETVDEGDRWTLRTGESVHGPPPIQLSCTSDGTHLTAYQPGEYELRRADGSSASAKVAELPPHLSIEGPWQVEFAPPSGSAWTESFPRLLSWPLHDKDAVRYFSGTAIYRTEFTVPAELCGGDYRMWLDLGEVEVLAAFRINGNDVATVWKPPFGVDATDWVEPGMNQLEVVVTNLWINRLIGDEQFAADYPTDATGAMTKIPAWLSGDKQRPSNQRQAVSIYKHWSAGDPLQPSGLIGPVRIHFGERHEVP